MGGSGEAGILQAIGTLGMHGAEYKMVAAKALARCLVIMTDAAIRRNGLIDGAKLLLQEACAALEGLGYATIAA